MPMEAAPPEVLYQGIWERYQDSEKLPPELAKRFSGTLRNQFLRLALFSTRQSIHRDIRASLDRIIRVVRDSEMFDVRLEGEEKLRDCALLLGNHQGPSGESRSRGGLETIFAWKVAPLGTRVVLKDELLTMNGGLTKRVGACVLRKANPIALHRPKEVTGNQREYASLLLAERRRVFQCAFDVIAGGAPVLLYPEGTRSPTGKILPFMRDFFDAALERYIRPCAESGQSPRIGLLVADTLQTVPRGLGGGATVFRRPLTLRGVPYDSKPLLEKLGRCQKPADERQLAKWFCEDARSQVQQELSRILQPSSSASPAVSRSSPSSAVASTYP